MPRETGGQDRAVLTTSLMAPPPAAAGDTAEPQPQTPLYRLQDVNIALFFPARSQLPSPGPASREHSEKGRRPHTLRSEAREGLKQLREAKVIETSEPLGFVAAQSGDTGDEGVRD